MKRDSYKKLKIIFPPLLSFNFALMAMVIYFFDPASKFIWPFAMIINIILVVISYNKIPFFILFVFFLKYTTIPYYYFVEGYQISAWQDYMSERNLNFISILLCIFYFGISLTFRSWETVDIFNIKKFKNTNTPLFYISLTLGALCSVFGLTGDTIVSVGYGSGGFEKSSIFEYTLIFLTISCFLSDEKKTLQNILLVIFVVFYAVKSFLYGGRVEVIQAGLIYLYIKKNLFISHRLPKLLILMVLGYGLIELVGAIRSNPILVLKVINLDFSALHFSGQDNGRVLINNASDVTQASARILGMIEFGEISDIYRLLSFLSYILSLPAFLISKDFASYQNLASYKQDIYRSGGGGLIIAYFYTWLGFLGPLVAGLWIGHMSSWLYQIKSRSKFIYALLVLTTFPRWYAYGPILLVKFCVFGVVFFYLADQLIKLLIKKDN